MFEICQSMITGRSFYPFISVFSSSPSQPPSPSQKTLPLEIYMTNQLLQTVVNDMHKVTHT
jgi:hypothetical protein